MTEKRCKECGGTYPIEFFPKQGRHTRMPKTICFGCRQTLSDAKKKSLTGRMRKKVASTLRLHARKFGYEVNEFCLRFGHKVEEWLHKLQHAWANGCPYCFGNYREMAIGLAAVTFEMIDPGKPPYATNFQWACATCNKEKQKSPPEEWGAKQAGWRMWPIQQEKIREDPYKKFPLFGGELEKLID